MQSPKENYYYTTGHEWIRFQGDEAYIGVSDLKFAGAKQIKKVDFIKIYGFKKKGEVLATIKFDHQQINVHMPVAGTIISINDVNLLVNTNILLTQAEKEGWLAKIRVNQPLQKDGLLSYEQYKSI
jgi:glycine cleavage system H protein